MQIVLDTYGLSFSVRNGCFLITCGDEKRMIHPHRVSSILITMPCRISSPAILLAASNEISLVICTKTGKPEARLWTPRFLNISTLRRKQYGFTRSINGLNWAKEVISIKLEGQRSNLIFLAERKPDLATEISDAVLQIEQSIYKLKNDSFTYENGVKQSRFLEAYAAKQYWQLIGQKFPEPYLFLTRIKQKPTDGFNPCINYLYGMLRNHVETAILSMGLDPALGCLHRDGYKLPSLVFDLMEPFRPITDRLLIEAILSGKLDNCIEKEKDSNICHVSKSGRKKIITLFNKELFTKSKYRGYIRTFNDHILYETKSLVDKIRES